MGSIRTRKDNGLFFMDFRYQGHRCREQSDAEDPAQNRTRMQKIEVEIKKGTFSYRQYFPNSKLADKFDQPKEVGG